MNCVITSLIESLRHYFWNYVITDVIMSFYTYAVFSLVGTLCAGGRTCPFFKQLLVALMLVLMSGDGVWWSPIFFFKQFLLALMLCSLWWGRCVLVVAHVVFETVPFGTYAVLSSVGALCSGGCPCSFLNSSFWHLCCVLIGGGAVCWWSPIFFLRTILLALMLCFHWWGRCVLVVAHVLF